MSEGNQTVNTALRTDIAEKLANSGQQVRGLVVEQLTQDEIKRRVQSVLNVLEKIETKQKELRKLENGGVVNFNGDGTALSPVFTKQQLEDMKKSKEHIAKLQGAMEKAFESSDFGKLHELAAQN